MNAYKKRQKHKKRNGIYRKWHRRLGFVASLFLLNLAITGILLNHYETFDFHKSHISSGWILNLYGIKSPQEIQCFQLDLDTLCQIDSSVYINDKFWQSMEEPVLAFINNNSGYLLASRTQVIWLTSDLQKIDSISISETLQQAVLEWHSYDGVLVAKTANNDYQLNLNTLEWQLVKASYLNIRPLNSITLPASKLIANDFRQRQISHLRFIQDIHSGRIIGLSGQVTNDLVAIILIWLAVSGFITWQRRLKKSKD